MMYLINDGIWDLMLFLVVRSTMEENVGGGQRSWRVRGFRCWGYSRQSLRLYGEKGGMTWGTSPVAVPRGFQQEAPAWAALQGGIVPRGRSAEWQEDWGWPWGRVERMSSLELGQNKVTKDQCSVGGAAAWSDTHFSRNNLIGVWSADCRGGGEARVKAGGWRDGQVIGTVQVRGALERAIAGRIS